MTNIYPNFSLILDKFSTIKGYAMLQIWAVYNNFEDAKNFHINNVKIGTLGMLEFVILILIWKLSMALIHPSFKILALLIEFEGVRNIPDH